MNLTRIKPECPARLLDGAEYHNAASHTTSEGLRERFAAVNPNWNKKPSATVTPIRKTTKTKE